MFRSSTARFVAKAEVPSADFGFDVDGGGALTTRGQIDRLLVWSDRHTGLYPVGNEPPRVVRHDSMPEEVSLCRLNPNGFRIDRPLFPASPAAVMDSMRNDCSSADLPAKKFIRTIADGLSA